MHPIRSILVPVDFSKVSANAFRYALRLADQLDASIDLLYVLPDTDGSLMSISLNDQYVGLGKEKLADFFTKGMTAVSSHLEHVPAVRLFVENGSLRATILRHLEAEQNNLILMGTQGEDNEEADNIFGSNTSNLVGRATCPVLVIPKSFDFRPLHSICYATDLTHIDAFHAGHVLKALRVFKPRLDFVHVKTGKGQKTNFDMDLLREVFHRPGTGVDTRFHVLEDDDVAEEILDYAEDISADLVVMHRPRRGWLSRLFSKSNTREAVLETTLPLLILPQEESDERKNEVSFISEKV
ncbi:universal stress protein [Neolewinella agarilytica]|uniref:Nucleotide-binding universal stress protein, UspA family n=1 Tax=Neolewinella agarilytica TaxID=478744 RepID=A0A1H9KX60_9BACT|nr:universal stress protein [Neolewinella agarilytica]SER03752.1 Nucleotide-binding universal stress protein, UspA family [Neolewinella agarilytica]